VEVLPYEGLLHSNGGRVVRHCAAVALLAILVSATAYGAGGNLPPEKFLNPDDTSGFILLDKTAIGLLPSETVAGSYVDQAVWSDDGRYVAFNRRSYPTTWTDQAFAERDAADVLARDRLDQERGLTPAQSNLGIWDSRSGKSVYCWSGKKENLDSLAWLHGTHTLLALTSRIEMRQNAGEPNVEPEPHTIATVWQIDATKGKAVALFTADGSLSLDVAAKAPLAIVSYESPDSEIAPFVWTIGVAPTAEKYPLPPGVGWYNTRWLDDGETPCFSASSINGDDPRVRVYYTFDTASKSFVQWDGTEVPKYWNPPDFTSSPSLVETKVDVSKDLAGPKLHTLWYEGLNDAGEKKRLLVTADTDFYAMSPTNDMVMFRAEGALFVRRIKSFPRGGVEAAATAVQRQTLKGRAVQTAIAFRLYCEDHGGAFPRDASDLREQMKMYTPDKLDSFTYLRNGEIADDMEHPADTAVGYFTGAGGYMVIFGDSHVRWVEDLSQVK
jgi:hypothetical protein